MSAPEVRTDHSQLAQASRQFEQELAAVQRTVEVLQQHLDPLQGGGWVGNAAKQFFQEMNASVLPSLKALEQALGMAAQTTTRISARWRQAEADAARVLSGDGAAGGGGAAGRLTPAGHPAEAGPALISTLKPPNPRTIRQAAARQRAAAESAAVDKLLSIFDPQVRDLAKRSPTLRAQVLALQKKGIMFLTGPRSQTIEPFITIAQSLTGPEAVAMIAHEVGHVASNDQEVARIVETPAMTRDQYVELNVANNLRNESLAQFNALQVRAELMRAGAGDIGVPGDQDPGFQRVYTEYAAGRLTREQAITQMGPVMGNVVRDAGPPPKTYRDYAIEYYRSDWDTMIAPTRRP